MRLTFNVIIVTLKFPEEIKEIKEMGIFLKPQRVVKSVKCACKKSIFGLSSFKKVN